MNEQAVTFYLGKQRYAIWVDQVIEMVQMVTVHELPEAPPGVLGVVNYRGEVIPLVDFRQIMGVVASKIRLNTPLLVVQTPSLARMALLVDHVIGVQTLTLDSLDLGQPVGLNPALLHGVAKLESHEVTFVANLAALDYSSAQGNWSVSQS